MGYEIRRVFPSNMDDNLLCKIQRRRRWLQSLDDQRSRLSDERRDGSRFIHLEQGRRYRIRILNASGDVHPIHLYRHSFDLTNISGRSSAGILKDVVMLGGYQQAEIDFIDNPGLTLFHCHQQLHMNFGFMTRFDYV